jgi:hypothetical protein
MFKINDWVRVIKSKKVGRVTTILADGDLIVEFDPKSKTFDIFSSKELEVCKPPHSVSSTIRDAALALHMAIVEKRETSGEISNLSNLLGPRFKIEAKPWGIHVIVPDNYTIIEKIPYDLAHFAGSIYTSSGRELKDRRALEDR